MEKLYKILAVIFHPVVIPTVGILTYFLSIPNSFNNNQKLALIGVIFTTTYIIPVLILLLLKEVKIINSYHVSTIKERKIPVAIMVLLFYLLGNYFYNGYVTRDIGLLFYATTYALIICYLLFAFKIKASIHLLSLGITISFFILMSKIYNLQIALIIIFFILISGLVGNARLYLKAHTASEVYIGFFIGVITPFAVFYLL
ncbi:hypothetical protein [Polaribacter tangerinus]|uniref:hypothetical protein n=1 Tax=Polaribacter tangerinus TaxID=1920034 RepID=UPI001E55763D|nr:hypothetical protein [Polaribacter tangerinus]